MTELQWLIKILTQHKLSTSLKDLFIERIGEVELNLSKSPMPQFIPRTNVQAPSTQKILDEMQQQPSPPVPPRTIVPTEIVTGKGNGTSLRGPRKF